VDATARHGTSPGTERSLSFLRRAGAFQQRLVVLMGARLALALVSLGLALALDTVGRPSEGEWGLYGTVAFAFVATVLYGLVLPSIRRPQRFAAINIATDIAVVSALVHFSGGPDSVLAFLYLLVAAYGALLFARRGALITAGLGIISYGAVLLASLAPDPGLGSEPHPPTVLFTVWAVHAGAIALVAALSSFLAAELRRTGEALRQRTSDLRDLAQLHQRTVESLMSGLLTIDDEGCVTSFNPEAERITGRASASVLGLSVEQVLPGVGELAIDRASAQGPHARTRMPFRNSAGEEIHLGVAAYFLRDENGEGNGHVIIFQDVTEVVAMEQHLRRSERLAAVGELSAGIAHEIRNPLAAISGAIQVLKPASPMQGESHRLMDIVLRETDRLNHLITDFLHYARPGPLQLEAVSVGRCAEELGEMLAASLPDGVRLEVAVPPDLGVCADPSQLRQVLWNLALNACQAMPDGGCLRLAAARAHGDAPQEGSGARRNGQGVAKDAWVEISVRDAGGGISREAMNQLFEPFFTTKVGGTGLGLATVHRIVQEHGGSIRVESEMGQGATFHIRLPAAEVTQ
jgi:two-component system sensor histidine kinase PilS (NtrC family)